MVNTTNLEENDAQPAISGINEKTQLQKEIAAQYAIIHSALKLISQQTQEKKSEDLSWKHYGEWAYNMKDLADWVKYYTERRRLHCPRCKADSTFRCEICDEVYEFHDEL